MARSSSRTGKEVVGHGIELVDPDAPADAGTEALDLPPSGEGLRQSSALIAAAALVVAVAVGALLVRQGETPPSPALDDPSTTEPDDGADLNDDDEESVHPVDIVFRGATRVTLPPVDPDPLAGDVGLLIAPTPNGYVVIDAVAGTADRVDLGATPTALAPAGPGEMFAHGRDSSVAIVSIGERNVELMAFDVDYFAPSADRAKVWLRFGTIPNRIVELDRRSFQHQSVTRGDEPTIDPRYRIGDGGEILDLTRPDGEQKLDLPDQAGEIDVVGVDEAGLIGAECIPDLCVVERLGLSVDGDALLWWEDGARVRGSPEGVDRVVVSPSGEWLAITTDSGLELRFDWTALTFPDTETAQFSADGTLAYLLGPANLTVVDLASLRVQSVELPPGLFEATDGWIVVERPTE